MKRINIETLTPVHIGSGKDLSANTEFLKFDEDEYSILSVIDETKILNIIGEDNIDKWVSIIQKNADLKEYLLQRKQNLISDDIDKRKIYINFDNISQNKTLKEQLHNGKGLPYIPGSSIKGAIRTAIVSEMAMKNKYSAKNKLKNNYRKFGASSFEKSLFGNNPNEDIFRFLQVGDAYFGYETIAQKSEVLNFQHNGWNFKRGNSSLIECIPAGINDVDFNLKINKDLLKLNKTHKDTTFLDEKELFKTINNHTIRLLKKEIEFWKRQDNINVNVFENYSTKLIELLEIAQNCNENEAVLRIGFGSGWNFITGGWSTDKDIMDDNTYDEFLKIARRKDYDESVPFPKTRMIADDGDLFGFVKLTF